MNGVEGSLCHDAPEKVWFVTGGFAVVSVSLLVVAIAFRLLLQQKEVRASETERGEGLSCVLNSI